MVPAGNKAKRLLSVNHTTKTIHHHHHYHHLSLLHHHLDLDSFFVIRPGLSVWIHWLELIS